MKKIAIFFFIFSGFCQPAHADHITGGEMYYTLAGNSGGEVQYDVTLKLYMRCNSGRQFNNPTIVSIFDRITGDRLRDFTVTLTSQENINLPPNSNPCVSNPPSVCYDVGYYHFTVSLPPSPHGYLLASQVNYRIAGINNLSAGYGLIGATYTAEIPGTGDQATGPQNSSAHFIGNDLVMVCANNPFTYSFASEDADGDRLQYSFCNAYISGSSGTVVAPPSPPYPSVPYGQGFSGTAPLGATVHINANTGLITGTAPEAGVYVVTVCVQEIRNGVVIATQRKDLQIFIAPCTIAAAVLNPEYLLCKASKTITLANNSTSPLIHTYNWQLTNATGTTIAASVNPTFTYTFADTGIYFVNLYVNRGEQCSDSTSSLIRVYPGFVPNFNFTGICLNKPTHFFDATASVYGTVNSWDWDFGSAIPGNHSSLQNPVYVYTTQGTNNVVLIVTDSKGCRDTVTKPVAIVDRPPITLAFRDTLICLGDRVQLQAAGEGSFAWTPHVQITNPNTPTPLVAPATTSTYTVHLDDNGCLNQDSVRVRVVDHVSLEVMADTLICQGDTIRLHLRSNGLHYAWTPAAQVLDPAAANPFCFTPGNTVYEVTAIIGSCSARAHVGVSTVPYPLSNAGPDTTICYGTAAQLHAQINGLSFSWSPSGTLAGSNTLSPLAHPRATTAYVLSVYDNQGCPKPGKDTMVVTVRPKIAAFAGRDTSVTVNQPLQLHATGGTVYAWAPGNNLSATNIADPVATFSSEADQFRYKVLVFDEMRCVDSAFISIKIYRTLPAVFVPTAFTPNQDGLNDVVAPIAVGIRQINYFRIFNRWGQLMFATDVNGRGWDGKWQGKDQASDTFVWIVSAIDYKGQPFFQRGTVTLIR